ncbi:MAG: glycosyltransferase family 39 protein, partial [Flavobacteriales bacterium]|nr:glycosyltransferase family 39 protein [Flavobacteriales bacterium]
CSAMAWYWYRCVFDERPKLGAHIWLAVLLSLSVYNHYFSGLLGILIWISGLLFAGRLHKVYYFGSGILAFILFLPHLSVSLTQLEHKGVGSWLRPPAPDFLWEWFMSLINYSTAALVLVAALIAWKTREFARNKQDGGSRLALLFLTWFAVSYAIGHAYSLMVDPLLHHGALLFASPFFCLGLAYFLAPRPPILAKAAAYGIAAILTFSLVWQRKHYEVFEQQPYDKVAKQLDALDVEGEPALAIVHQNPAYLARYMDVDALKNTRVINLAQTPLSNAELMEEVGNPKFERLYLDGRNWALTRGAEEVWSLDRRSNGFTFTGHHYSTRHEDGDHADHTILNESTGGLTFSEEFLELYKIGLDTAGIGFGDHVAAVLRFAPADSASGPWSQSDLHLVFDFSKNGEPLHYSSAIPQRDGFTHRGSFRLVHQLLLWDLFINYREMKGVELKVYVWNPTRLNLSLAGWEVNLIEGNPLLYSQLNRMP